MEWWSVTAAPTSHARIWGKLRVETGKDDHEGHSLLNILMWCTGVYKSEQNRQLSWTTTYNTRWPLAHHAENGTRSTFLRGCFSAK